MRAARSQEAQDEDVRKQSVAEDGVYVDHDEEEEEDEADLTRVCASGGAPRHCILRRRRRAPPATAAPRPPSPVRARRATRLPAFPLGGRRPGGATSRAGTAVVVGQGAGGLLLFAYRPPCVGGAGGSRSRSGA